MDARVRRRAFVVAALAVVSAAIAVAPLSAAEDNSYTVTALVSDQAGAGVTQDASLVNGWGLVAGPTTPWWVADNGTNLSTLYRGDGTKVALTVSVPGGPTGVVFNGTTGFLLGGSPARFIFASEDGKIRAWNGGAAATVVADRSAAGASYTGLAILGSRLYAANAAAGTVDVFDSAFQPTTVAGGFADRRIPRSFAPFGIQAIGSRIFVTYALPEGSSAARADDEDDDHGDGDQGGRGDDGDHGGRSARGDHGGSGFVDAFDADGNLLARVARRGRLDEPWGVALAPESFGRFSGDLLVGNFGDGTINAFEERRDGRFEHRGELRTADSRRIVIDGLWALEFGTGSASSGPTSTLFFTAGPAGETHGLFGTITPG